MGTVVLDSSILIGFLSDAHIHHEAAVSSIASLAESRDQILLPASVYAEILVHPIRENREEHVDRMILDANMNIVAIDQAIAKRAALLRANHSGLRLPDALALATAREHNATFVTVDDRLQRIADRMIPDFET